MFILQSPSQLPLSNTSESQCPLWRDDADHICPSTKDRVSCCFIKSFFSLLHGVLCTINCMTQNLLWNTARAVIKKQKAIPCHWQHNHCERLRHLTLINNHHTPAICHVQHSCLNKWNSFWLWAMSILIPNISVKYFYGDLIHYFKVFRTSSKCISKSVAMSKMPMSNNIMTIVFSPCCPCTIYTNQ